MELVKSEVYLFKELIYIIHWWDFPGGPVVKNILSNAEDGGSIPSQVVK